MSRFYDALQSMEGCPSGISKWFCKHSRQFTLKEELVSDFMGVWVRTLQKPSVYFSF